MPGRLTIRRVNGHPLARGDNFAAGRAGKFPPAAWAAAPLAILLAIFAWAAPGRADDLRYNWRTGEEYSYKVNLEILSPGQPKVDEHGTVRFRAEQVQRRSRTAEEEGMACGTGFVVHPSGYVLTCAHVVENAAKIEVTIGEKDKEKKFEARLIAQDKPHDIALLQVDALHLPSLPLADSDRCQLGEDVVAIGFPLAFDLGSSVKISRGVLSGLHVDLEGLKNMLQVDAGVNHGNSGGPLVNDRGEVIGVVSNVLNPKIGNNVGFAQPINEGRALLEANSVPILASTATEAQAAESTKNIVSRVVPSVAYILVTPKPKSDDWRKLNYNRVLGSNQRSGTTIVDGSGAVVDEGGGDLTMGLMGNIGFAPLGGPGEQKWQERRVMMFMQPIETGPRGQAGKSGPQQIAPGHGSNHSFGQHHRGNPRGMQRKSPQQPHQPQPGPGAAAILAIPALEIAEYEIVSSTTGLVTIKKRSAMAAAPAAEGQPPAFVARGEGIIEIDTAEGCVRSSNFIVSKSSPLAPKDVTTYKLSYQRLENGKLASLPSIPSTSHASSSQPGGTSSVPAPAPGGGPAPPIARPTAKLAEIPDATARGQAEKLLDDLFEKELAGLDSSAKRLELARTMLAQAGKQKPGTADHYVLLERARDLATMAGDISLSCQMIDTLSAYYQVNGLQLKAGALGTLAESVGSTNEQTALVGMALALLDQAIAADELDAARTLGKVAFAAAKKSEDKELIAKTSERAKAFKAVQKEFEAFNAALATLKDDPQNAPASTAAGKYYCLAKDDWAKGLPLLAQGDDPLLSKLATTELAKPTAGSVIFDVAEGWGDLAEHEEGTRQIRVQLHARNWYQKALPSLNGLARAKAEKFLASSPTSLAAALGATGVAADPKQILARIEKVVHNKRQKNTREVGMTVGKNEFKVMPPQGALLIGFDVNANDQKVFGLRPIFLTAKGQTSGKWCGVSKAASETKRVLAKQGFAVGALKVKAGAGIDGLSVHFMQIGAEGLDTGNAYDSDWFGSTSGAKSGVKMSGNGLPVIGIHGHFSPGELSALGLVTAQK